MTVVDKRGALMDEIGGVNNQFPIGMRVLAVDDNPTCLKLLETSLRKCQYHVTITNQAVKALQLLRENKNNYDLVISDVNMPDIDGFKLLELIGLEMDLPVIMLSEYSDTKLVMKGITHGARDYLLKPVRYEELKNIWQHVIRGKRVESKDQNKSVDQGKAVPGTGEAGQVATSRNTDQDAKLNRKRKDQNEDEEEDFEDNENEREDLGTQKKPRVVWSVELHGKFVSAVNQLGLDKAVPKKILDLMNVEGLTRENVASHLQKYRLYLKRLNNVAIQQANMVAAFGNKDSSYLRMGSLDGLNDFRSLAGPGRYSSTSLSSYLPGGMLARLNAPATLTLRGITSSGMVQPGPSQNFSNSFDSLSKFPSGGSPANNGTNLIQGFPTLNQFQQSKAIDPTKDLNLMGNSNAFTAITSFPEVGVGLGNSNNTMNIAASSNSLLLQGNPQQTQIRTLLNNQSSPGMASSNPDLFDIGVGGFSNPLHPLNEQLPLTNFRETASSSNPQVQSTPIDFSSSVAHSQDVGCPRDLDSQAGLIGNLVQNRSYTPDQRQDCSQNLIHNYSSINGNIVKSNANYMLDQTKSQDGYLQNSYDSLDDVMSAMVKRTDAMLMDGELEFDAYSSLGSCM